MNVCKLTDSAIKQIENLCQAHNAYAVSLNLKGGGCAGFEYDWGLINSQDEVESKDIVVQAGNGNFVIGASSLMFLIGTEVDYISSLVGSNFEIRNPNAKSSCGCGVSVNFDLDKLIPV